MVWVLILWVGTSDSSALSAVEFKTEQSCQHAGEAAAKKLGSILSVSKFVCVPKE